MFGARTLLINTKTVFISPITVLFNISIHSSHGEIMICKLPTAFYFGGLNVVDCYSWISRYKCVRCTSCNWINYLIYNKEDSCPCSLKSHHMKENFCYPASCNHPNIQKLHLIQDAALSCTGKYHTMSISLCT